MKPKYSIRDIVKIKATGEKVMIMSFIKIKDLFIYNTYKAAYKESELKPYCPSRTGKYRNEKGQFMSKSVNDIYKMYERAVQEQREHFSYEEPKQRNYQKISQLEQIKSQCKLWIKDSKRILDKIDELIQKINSSEEL